MSGYKSFAIVMLGYLVLFGAQAASVQKVGEVYYEYIDPVVTPYNHHLNLPNGEGPSTREFKTLDQAESAVRVGQSRAISEFLAKFDSKRICSFGPISEHDQQVAYTATSGQHLYSSSSVIVLKREPNPPCSENNQSTYPVDLVYSNITWNYSCPHGYLTAGTDSNGVIMCRRPLVHEPCGCGNPITHASEKIQPELDYRSADGGLELMRTYSSSRYPGPGWTHRFDTRVLFGRPFTSVIRPDGSRLFFEFNGSTFKSIQPTQATLALNQNGFIFTTDTDVKEIYGSDGVLDRLVYRDGRTVTLARTLESDTVGVLTVTDSYGRQLGLRYEVPADGTEFYLRKAILPDGVQFEFQSDALTGMFVRVIREHYLRSYDYEATKLTGITDENGIRYAEFGYGLDYYGARTTASHHVGNVDAFMIADQRFETGAGYLVVTEPLGVNTAYNYATVNGISRMVGITRGAQGTSTMSYDANGNIASHIDFNRNLTRTTYDLTRNLETSRTEGLTALGAVTSDTRTVETTWHPTFRLPTQILIKDSGGVLLQQSNMAYDQFGHMTSNGIKDAVQNTVRTTRYNYRYSSTLPWHVEELTVIGPRIDVPDTTTISYWPFDAICAGSGIGQDKGCRGKVKSVTNTLSQTIQYETYDAHGRPTAIRNPNGLLTEMSYTSRGWMTSMTVGGETTGYEYDGVGQVKKVTLPNNTTLTYQYDDAHRLQSVADNQGNKVSYLLDNAGNRTSEVVKDPTGNIKRQISRVYDNLNRLNQVTGAQQ